MKKISKVLAIILTFVVSVIAIGSVNAATLPATIKSDQYRIAEYIKGYRVVVKTVDGGKNYVYCMNMDSTYASNITFNKTDKVDPGFVYILKNRPQTTDKDRDFYVTQMAVWYYQDYLNQNNFNLELDVKKYILGHKDTEDVSKDIYNLYYGAKYYTEKGYSLELDKSPVTFSLVDNYYVSSEIKVKQTNLDDKIKYSLNGAPIGTLIVKSDNGIKVKVPADKVENGKTYSIKLFANANVNKDVGYYYYFNSNYQKVLFSEPQTEVNEFKDVMSMTFMKEKDNKEHDVYISKTDITQAKEIKGATLVIKDANGKEVDRWVSTTESHKVKLLAGNYSLTEIIAPKGYKLSTTTINFLVDNNGGVFVKNDKDVYINVDKVIMVNELNDVVSFAKKETNTDIFVPGATLVIKNEVGEVIKEFVSSDTVYSLELNPGKYTLSEKIAPKGYLLSNEIVYFELYADGTLKVMNKNGDYVDSAMVNFYNTKETIEEVKVPATNKNNTLLVIGGIALLIGGIACARKTIKEC